jgi:predicted esterase
MKEAIGSMSVKSLRAYIASAGLTSDDCFEITDLRARAVEAAERLATRRPSTSSGGLAAAGPTRTERRMYYGLDCTLVGTADVLSGGATPGLIVIFLHGLGASSSDFASFPSLFRLDDAISNPTLWVFPQAPVGAMLLTAWWTIDVMQWMGAMKSGEAAIARLIRDVPPGLPDCRSKITKLVDEVCLGANNCPTSRVVLGGFSQGAMTSLDAALSMPKDRRVGGVISVSGAPIVVEEWHSKLHVHKGLPVLITHGRADTTLPFPACGWLEEMLRKNGAAVTTSFHLGGHELGPSTVVNAMRAFLVRVSKSAS